MIKDRFALVLCGAKNNLWGGNNLFVGQEKTPSTIVLRSFVLLSNRGVLGCFRCRYPFLSTAIYCICSYLTVSRVYLEAQTTYYTPNVEHVEVSPVIFGENR